MKILIERELLECEIKGNYLPEMIAQIFHPESKTFLIKSEKFQMKYLVDKMVLKDTTVYYLLRGTVECEGVKAPLEPLRIFKSERNGRSWDILHGIGDCK
jgi:hypothetical protein